MPGPILFIDQVIVSPELRVKGLSLVLHERLLSSSAGTIMYGAILRKPVRNLVSAWFFRSLGWSCLEELEQKDQKWKTLTWAMFTRDN